MPQRVKTQPWSGCGNVAPEISGTWDVFAHLHRVRRTFVGDAGERG